MEIVKKAIATVAIILMILASSVTIAVSEQKGKVMADTLRLRKEASLESTVLELLYKDDTVEIVGEEGDWYKVKFKTYTGYVSKEFIQKDSKNSTETKNEENNQNNNEENNNTENKTQNNETVENNKEANNTNNVKNAVVNSDVNVHILPLINSNIIEKFKANTNVEIVSVTGVWAYVKSTNVAGWIILDKVSVSETTNTENQTTQSENNNQTETNQKVEDNNQKTEENTTSNNTTTEAKTSMYSSPKTYYVKSSAVNVREKSSTDSSVVTTVSQNTEVKVLGEESNWYKVEVSGKKGYMLKSLLSSSKVEVTTRSNTQEREDNIKAENAKTENTKTENVKAESKNGTKKEETATKTSNNSSTKGEEIIAYAKKYLGCRYVYGGSGPSTFDCSGFTMYVYKHFGYSLPHNAVTQANKGKYVAKSDLQPGDLIIFNNSANTSIGHVGMYVGGGNFIHASSGSGKIVISPLSGSYYKARYVTARRLI